MGFHSTRGRDKASPDASLWHPIDPNPFYSRTSLCIGFEEEALLVPPGEQSFAINFVLSPCPALGILFASNYSAAGVLSRDFAGSRSVLENGFRGASLMFCTLVAGNINYVVRLVGFC